MTRFYVLFAILLLPIYMQAQKKPNRIAFVADIHFMDIYADYENFEGLPVPKTDKKAKIRTMKAQLHSTRLFNENYFVLKAVLDDIVKRGIKIVALPGDYTDDGQPVHLKGLRRILDLYHKKHGISFFITTGNHDPVRPYDLPAGKKDFLGKEGKNQPLFSDKKLYTAKSQEEEVILESGLQMAGYKTILHTLSDYGFFPQANYSYWETPFSSYTPQNYSFHKAKKFSKIEKRFYQFNDSLQFPDASYLVEPVEGIWLLAIDGNTYVPQQNGQLNGAGKGYNIAIDHKKHLFQWIKKVAENANKLNKKLVAFSHYPAIDFNEDASSQLGEFLGPNKWQLERVPEERIAKTLAEAGIKIHFAGHMHINDTGKRKYAEGNFLINIQTPSLAAYIPGYKILQFEDDYAKVETVSINEVPHFDELFSLYKMEHDYLEKTGKPVWDEQILNSKNYQDFTEAHLENLVQLRFIPTDWSPGFYDFLSGLSGKDLLLLSNYHGSLAPEAVLQNKTEITAIEDRILNKDLDLEAFKNWDGQQMILDFYKIRNADQLAFQDIPALRLQQYSELIGNILESRYFRESESVNAQKLKQFVSIYNQFLHGLPASNFKIDLNTGEISKAD